MLVAPASRCTRQRSARRAYILDTRGSQSRAWWRGFTDEEKTRNMCEETESEMKLPIYMDNHSTTPVDPRVLDAMLPYFTNTFGNAASRNHVFGWTAEKASDLAREKVAS